MNEKRKIKLLAGTPVSGDANHRYPDGEILNSKSFYDQNSHIMPVENLREYREVLEDGKESSWLLYIPAGYDGTKPVPLVIARHGGGQSGWGQCYATSWCYAAEREGFIVLYPDKPRRDLPKSPPHRPGLVIFDLNADEDTFAIREMVSMIRRTEEEYRIDTSRIFMQGMSQGNMLTLQYALVKGGMLAGISGSAGPMNGADYFPDGKTPRKHQTYIPAFISFVSNNNMLVPPEYRPDDPFEWNEMKALSFWKTVNGVESYPRICIHGVENYAFYDGKYAPVGYRDVLGRGHGQTIDDGDMVWCCFFSGLRRREDGTIEQTAALEDITDHNAAAVAVGCAYAYVNNRKVPLDDKGSRAFAIDPMEMQEDRLKAIILRDRVEGYEPITYVPVTFFSCLGFAVSVSDCGKYAHIVCPDGVSIDLSYGNAGIVVNNRVQSLEWHVEMRDGVLYAPFKRLVQLYLNRHVAERDGVLYVNDTFGLMTPNMAAIIRDILKD